MPFEIISDFEKSISNFFGSKYAVCVDSCTHGVELCLRLFTVDFS
jgi:dTDP-4-amino-4,6-dideoxygalactose transaminase